MKEKLATRNNWILEVRIGVWVGGVGCGAGGGCKITIESIWIKKGSGPARDTRHYNNKA